MSRVGGEESINSMAYSQRLIHARSFDIQERCVPWYNPTYVHSCVPRYLQLHIHPVEMYIDTAKTPPCHTTEPYIYITDPASSPPCLSVKNKNPTLETCPHPYHHAYSLCTSMETAPHFLVPITITKPTTRAPPCNCPEKSSNWKTSHPIPSHPTTGSTDAAKRTSRLIFCSKQ